MTNVSRDRPTFHFVKEILLQMIGWMQLHHRQLNINLLEKTLKDNNLLNKPVQIYNVDETGIAYTLKGQKR